MVPFARVELVGKFIEGRLHPLLPDTGLERYCGVSVGSLGEDVVSEEFELIGG